MNVNVHAHPAAPRIPCADPLERLLVGEAPPMAALKRMVSKVAGADVPVLVTGPTGAGKEVVAQAIHTLSGRAGPIIAVNCGAIPRELLESQLFGHEKGAFTGAQARYIGLVEQAAGGTLFLDEIGEMPQDVQVKLLRALETREVQRVGGTGTVPVSFRLVSATNRDLRAAAREGDFRLDLLYRVGVFELSVPPLADHLDDIPALLAHMSRGSGAKGPLTLTSAAIGVLSAHAWPGNVRELRNFHDRAQVLFGDAPLGAREARVALHGEGGALAARSPGAGADAMLTQDSALSDFQNALKAEGEIDLPGALASMESALVATALGLSDGCVSRAAGRLGLKRTTLIGRMKKLGLGSP
ncbi:MAG: sigma-54 dependent transcriptional regulator [Pseudomonadota bacterium]